MKHSSVVFTDDCGSCTRPISINPGSVEAGELGLTRGTCFVAGRLQVIAVAGLLLIWWCVFGATGICVFSFVFAFSNARGLLQVRGRLPCHLSTMQGPGPVQTTLKLSEKISETKNEKQN